MRLSIVLIWLLTAGAVAAADEQHAKIKTSMGDIIVALEPEKAPATVANFIQYAKKGHYDRTLIHRVVPDRVIQGGGYSRIYTERPLEPPIPYEGDNGLLNLRGAIAMARSSDPESAQAQWFINLADNDDLDHVETEVGPKYGYAVFGRVIEGMSVVDAIGSVATGPGGPFDAEAPLERVTIERVDPIEWPQSATSGKALNPRIARQLSIR